MYYRIAYAMDSGEWDIFDEFEADSDDQANKYAESEYPDCEWYVLDADNNNINT